MVVEVSTDKPTLTVDQKPECLRTMMDAPWGGRGEPLLARWGGHWVHGGGSLRGSCWGSRCGTGPARKQWSPELSWRVKSDAR